MKDLNHNFAPNNSIDNIDVPITPDLPSVEDIAKNFSQIESPGTNVNDILKEEISQKEFNDMIEKLSEKDKYQKNVHIQRMLNEWLKSKGYPTITELRAKQNKVEILGILIEDHKRVLQSMIFEYCTKHNIDKPKTIIGVLSSEENEYVDKLLEEYLSSKSQDMQIESVLAEFSNLQQKM